MDSIVIQYELNRNFLNEFRESVMNLLQNLILPDQKYYRIQSKLISSEALADYIEERKKRGIRELTELADFPNLVKIRLVTFGSDDIDHFMGFIMNVFETSRGFASKDNRKFSADKFKIQKLDYIMQFRYSTMEKLEHFKIYRGYKFQLEVSTILQLGLMLLNEFTMTNSVRVYPKIIEHNMNKLAAFIEQTDEIFVTTRNVFENADKALSKYQSDLEKYPDDQNLNLANLMEVCISDSIVLYLDERIAENVQSKYEKDFSMLDFYIQKLEALGIVRMSQLMQLLFDLQKHLLIFNKYFANKASVGSWLFTGISLGVLTNYLIAEKNDIDFALDLYKKLYTDELNHSDEGFYAARNAYIKTLEEISKNDDNT